MSIRHLERMQHDVTCQTAEIWCDALGWVRDGAVTADVGECDCQDCLRELRDAGDAAARRLAELIPDPEPETLPRRSPA